MASACINNISIPPEGFLDYSPSYDWTRRKISCNRDSQIFSSTQTDLTPGLGDFEFRLDDPVNMLPADELFSDGKIVPSQVSTAKSSLATSYSSSSSAAPETGSTTISEIAEDDGVIIESEANKTLRRNEASDVSMDPYLFSPKAPRCTARWRELLGLRKLAGGGAKQQERCSGNVKTATSLSCSTSLSSSSYSSSISSGNNKSIRNFLSRTSRLSSSSDPTLSLPLLRDASDCESVISISSSRLSLSSSSSSGPDHDDLPRLSLDSATTDNYKKSTNHLNHVSVQSRSCSGHHPRSIRMTKPARMIPADNLKPLIDHPSAPPPCHRSGRSPIRRSVSDDPTAVPRGLSVDSPRMNSWGKVIFHGLERSSSSPSSFNGGGPRYNNKHRAAGMERSYSANVRVTPVLNVPVCSLRGSSRSGGGGVFGFGQFFSSNNSTTQQSSTRKEANGGKSQHHRHHQHVSGVGGGKRRSGRGDSW